MEYMDGEDSSTQNYAWNIPCEKEMEHVEMEYEDRLVQKTLFKAGENDFLNQFMIRLLGGRFKKMSRVNFVVYV